MKKVILTMVALLSMTAMQAQTSDNPERKAPKKPTAEEMTNRMVKDLGLTDAQKDKVLKLNKQYEGVLGMPAMRGPRPPRPEGMDEGPKPDAQTGATQQRPAGVSGQRPERPQFTEEQRAEMQKRHAQREEYNTKLKDILTDDQYKSFQKMQRRGHGRGHGPGHGQGNHQGPRPDMAPQE